MIASHHFKRLNQIKLVTFPAISSGACVTLYLVNEKSQNDLHKDKLVNSDMALHMVMFCGCADD